MSEEWDEKLLDDLISEDAAVQEEGMSVWAFLEHMGAGRLLRVTSAEAFSLALDEVFLEMYHNVLKRVSCHHRVFFFFLPILMLSRHFFCPDRCFFFF